MPRARVTIDEELLDHARELTGISDPSAVITAALEELVRLESTRRESGRLLVALGGSDPDATAGPRR